MEYAKIQSLFDLRHTISAPMLEKYVYPWEALGEINEYIKKIGTDLNPDEYIKTGEDIWISKSAVVAPSACINGPCIIGHNTEVRHCAFIRGGVIIGENCVIGNSTELKNCIIFDNVQVPHYNYVGDSILGYKSHMGAGSVTSNVKSDKTPVIIKNINGETVNTNRKKCGAMVGDYTEVGCNAVLNPGTVIGRNSNIYPTSCVRGVIPENSIYKNNGNIVRKRCLNK